MATAQILSDDRLSGDEGATRRRRAVGFGDRRADHALTPTDAGANDEVAVLAPMLEDFAERHAGAAGAEPRRLGEHLLQVGRAERQRAKRRQRLLLPQHGPRLALSPFRRVNPTPPRGKSLCWF